LAETWEEPPLFVNQVTGRVRSECRARPAFLQHGWVRFWAWARPEDYLADEPSTPVAFQVLHVAMVHMAAAHPDLTCVVLRDGRWYVAMALDDVLRVMEVLT
jgi:hypothetical protein